MRVLDTTVALLVPLAPNWPPPLRLGESLQHTTRIDLVTDWSGKDRTSETATNFWCRRHFHLTISCGPETKVLDSVYYQEPISAKVTPLWRFKIAKWKEGTYKSYKSVIQTCFSGLTWLTKEESGRSGMLGSVRHWGGMSQHALRGGHSAGDTVNCWSHR